MLKLLSYLYGRGVARRNDRYDRHTLPIVPVDKPVISVGNLTTGGSGKTPTVQMLVRLLQSEGRRPAIVMRGYGRRSRGLLVVHDGQNICASVDAAGDEAFLHAQTLNVPVVVSSDKVEAAAYAAGTLPCDVIVVDDGFQHRALHRDIDMVIVDRSTITGTLLPAGRLREPHTSLSRADIVLITEDVHHGDVEAFLNPTAHVFRLERAFTCMAPTTVPVVAVSGIARPERFHDALRQRGYSIAATKTFRDHHRYTAFNIRTIVREAHAHHAQIITTAKDAVKLRPLLTSDERMPQISVLELEIRVHSSSSFLSAVLPRISP